MPGDVVADWSTDYDVVDPAYAADPAPIWNELRGTCPIAHTERHGGSWLPTRYEDVRAIAHDPAQFSSREITVMPRPEHDPEQPMTTLRLPPIEADAPVHTWSRRVLLPWFSHGRVAALEPVTRDHCRRLVDRFASTGRADAAADYAQQIPAFVISKVLGVSDDMSDTFTGWVRDAVEFGYDVERLKAAQIAVGAYLLEQFEDRKANPGADLLTELVTTVIDGEPLSLDHQLGIAAITLVAGVDTTWSGIGSCLFHLASNPSDRRRLVAEPELLPIAIEELLRAYSPVTMARIVTSDVDYGGCPMKEGDRVLMNFPAANRDPDAFERADEVVIDREVNRHLAFGVGIHRCAGSNLARMELRVALEEWLARIPEFEIADGATVQWAGGQVRGPRQLPVVFPTTSPANP